MATIEIAHPVWNSSNTLVNAPVVKDMMKSIHNAMISVNPEILVQTADTGQATLGTIDSMVLPAPTTSNYVHAFFVYKFNDGVRDIFIKMRWYNVSAANTFCLSVEIGTGTNGAGSITGILTSSSYRMTIGNGSESGNNTATLICCKEGFFGISTRAFDTYQGHFHFSYPETINGDLDTSFLVVSFHGFETTNAIILYQKKVVSISAPSTEIISRTGILTHTPPLSAVRMGLSETQSYPVMESLFAVPHILKDPNCIYVRFSGAKDIFQYDNKTWIRQNIFAVTQGDRSSCMAMRWE